MNELFLRASLSEKARLSVLKDAEINVTKNNKDILCD